MTSVNVLYRNTVQRKYSFVILEAYVRSQWDEMNQEDGKQLYSIDFICN